MSKDLHLFTPIGEVELEDCKEYQFTCDGINFYLGEYRNRYKAFDLRGGTMIRLQTVTHVLDLSKLTTKDMVYKAVDKYCSDLDINTETVIENYFKELLWPKN